VKPGRPSQLRRRELPPQIEIREKFPWPAREWRLSLHERRAYHLAGLPAARLGAALALRPGRRGHLTAAIAEGVLVTVGQWIVSALSRTFSLAGHFPPRSRAASRSS
jgi:lipopolysaccharide export system permease protein